MKDFPVSPLPRGAFGLDRTARAAGSLLGWFTLAMVLLQSGIEEQG